MFNSPDFPKALDEELFSTWLEHGRESKISYSYLLIIWDEFESDYRPDYVEDRDEINQYEKYNESTARESLVAAYDLYSESRIV